MDQHNHEFPLVALNVTAGGRVLAHHVNYGAAALQPLSERSGLGDACSIVGRLDGHVAEYRLRRKAHRLFRGGKTAHALARSLSGEGSSLELFRAANGRRHRPKYG